MNALLDFLKTKMQTPISFGLFHIISVIICIIVITLLIIKFKNCKDKTFRLIALISWIIMLTFEIYKQIVLSFDKTESGYIFYYAWYVFPFHLSSTP